MKKRTPLQFSLESANQPVIPPKHANNPTQKQSKPQTSKQVISSRAGRQFIAAHVTVEAAKQFKLLAVQQERTVQTLLAEAINDLFAKHGLSRIADE